MNDLKPFEHGSEGTHRACQEIIEKYGGKAVCCECNGHRCKDFCYDEDCPLYMFGAVHVKGVAGACKYESIE